MKHAHTFFHFFPPPAFLAISTVGLEIGSSSVRCAELLNRGGQLTLRSYGEKEIPEGTISAGKILNRGALQEALLSLKREHDLKFVRVSLSEERGYLFTETLPSVLKKEIRGSVLLRLEEHVPITPSEAVFDYELSPCDYLEKKVPAKIGVAVVPLETVNQYLSIFSSVGLVPVSFELEAHALKRALLRREDCGQFLIVDIRGTHTSIVIVSRGIAHFTVTLPIGAETITQTVARALGVSREQATLLREKYGLIRRHGKGELFSVLAPVVSTLCDETKRYINFWSTHPGKEAVAGRQEIEKVILCGNGANTPGLDSYFSGSLKMNVVLGNPWINITSLDSYIPELGKEDSLRYATALGLALGGFDEN